MRAGRAIVIAAVAATFGYLLGPTVVQAATTSVVRIGSGTTLAQAKVSAKRLWVDTEASTYPCFGRGSKCLDTEVGGIVYQLPGGNDQLGQGSSSDVQVVKCLAGQFAVLSSVVVDGPTTPTTITITADATPFGSNNTLSTLWRGTVAAGGHLDDSFDGGVVFGRTLSVTETGDALWILNGSKLQCTGSAARAREIHARASIGH